MNHSKAVHPKPHRKYSPPWKAIPKVLANGEEIELKHFKPIKALGSGDTGSVHLVELCETGHYFAMKAMDKNVMLNRNKVHRACAEREILDVLDHPFLPALYASFQTKTHICLITDYYPGGELFILLYREPTKVLKEDAVRSHSGTRISSLSRYNLQRDLKPENILLQNNGKLSVRKVKLVLLTGGILEFSCMKCFYGYTPFRGKTRQKTFANILHKDLKFRRRKEVSVQGKQLMYRLPTRDPKNRLGSREEANEVKQHPFFRCINWALVRCMYPPKLDSPLFDENEKEVDPGLDELQKHF